MISLRFGKKRIYVWSAVHLKNFFLKETSKQEAMRDGCSQSFLAIIFFSSLNNVSFSTFEVQIDQLLQPYWDSVKSDIIPFLRQIDGKSNFQRLEQLTNLDAKCKKVLFKVSFTNILCHVNCRPSNISSLYMYYIWSKVDYFC